MKNCKKFSIILFFVSLSQIIYAQPDTLWTKTIGGNQNDESFSLQETLDGGFIVTGYTKSFGAGNEDIWLIKTDSNGDTTWTKTFGGSNEDVGYSVQQTSDSGYVVVGYTNSFGAGEKDAWLLKTDSNGDTSWTKTFGGSNHDQGFSVQQTSDGGYIITGDTFSYGVGSFDVWLIKTDASGDTLWTKTFGGSSYERGHSVQQTTDGGYIIAGYTNSFGAGSIDVWIIKTDESGNEVWIKTFGGNTYDKGLSVQQTTDGGYIIAGFNKSYGPGVEDVWLLKTDAAGDTIWTKLFGGVEPDEGTSVEQTSDGGYIITGMVTTSSHDLWIIKTDAAGDTTWTKTFGGSGVDKGTSVQQTSDLGYIVTGVTESSGKGKKDIWLIRLAPPSDVSVESNVITPNGFVLDQNFPNPFNPTTQIHYTLGKNTKIEIAVYDLLGRKVATLVDDVKTAGEYTVSFDASNIPSGIYFYRFEAGSNTSYTKKMLFLK